MILVFRSGSELAKVRVANKEKDFEAKDIEIMTRITNCEYIPLDKFFNTFHKNKYEEFITLLKTFDFVMLETYLRKEFKGIGYLVVNRIP